MNAKQPRKQIKSEMNLAEVRKAQRYLLAHLHSCLDGIYGKQRPHGHPTGHSANKQVLLPAQFLR